MRCILRVLCIVSGFGLALPAGVAFAVDGLSAQKADEALQQAADSYKKLEQENKKIVPNMYTYDALEDVQVWYEVDDSVSPDLTHPHYYAGQNASEINLEDLMLRVDLENVTLAEALHRVINRIGDQTGPWQLRWRLKPENASLKEETINLIAESNFGDFVAYLAERVKNMTGIQLFVSVFDGARVIVISDTYH